MKHIDPADSASARHFARAVSAASDAQLIEWANTYSDDTIFANLINSERYTRCFDALVCREAAGCSEEIFG
jgi:hypothetical protein